MVFNKENEELFERTVKTFEPRGAKNAAYIIDLYLEKLKKELTEEDIAKTQYFLKRIKKVGSKFILPMFMTERFGRRGIKKVLKIQNEIEASTLPEKVKKALIKFAEIWKISCSTIKVPEEFLWRR